MISAYKPRGKDKELRLLLPGLESSLAKLESYYSKIQTNPYYALALILDPQNRTNYLEKIWPKDRADKAKWAAEYHWIKTRDQFGLIPRPHENREVTPEAEQDPFTMFEAQLRSKIRPKSQDEYDDYIKDTSYNATMTPLQWWLEKSQRKRWPRLSQLAIDIHSIPAMSAEPERIFSGGRRTISWDRGNLSIETLELLECQKNWARKRFPRDLQEPGQESNMYELVVHRPEDQEE